MFDYEQPNANMALDANSHRARGVATHIRCVQATNMTTHQVGPETKRLHHRALTPADADAFFALNSNPEVMRYTGEPPLESVEAAREAIENYPDFQTIGYGRWGCVLKKTQQLIGFCGLKYLADLGVVDIGYRFLPEFWGQGLATEAALASIQFGFETLELERIEAFVLPQNAGSIRVLEKVEMQPDGTQQFDDLMALRYAIERS